MAEKTSLKKRIYILSVFIAIIPTIYLSKVDESPWSWIPRIPIQVYNKKFILKVAFPRGSPEKTTKKCTKQCDARVKLFCLLRACLHGGRGPQVGEVTR